MKIIAMLFICGRPASDVMPILASRKEALSRAYKKQARATLSVQQWPNVHMRYGWKRPIRDRKGLSKAVGRLRPPERMTIRDRS